MIFDEKNFTLENCCADISSIYDELSSLPQEKLSSFDKDATKLCIVDVINGFIKFGALADASISPIIANINSLARKMSEKGFGIVSFFDNHQSDSPEFESFPPHCLEGSAEASIVDELKWLFGYENFLNLPKKSTNAFFDDKIRRITAGDEKISTFIVVGDCTDICVLQLALAMKIFGNASGRNIRVVVPVDRVDTYGAPSHSKELMNLTALKIMKNSGVEIVKKINVAE